jgi:hypothetical protein
MLRKDFLLKHITEEKMEWTRRRGIMSKQPLDDLKKKKILYFRIGNTGELALEETVDLS